TASTPAVKRTRRRSSGTRQAFASQENTLLLGLLGGLGLSRSLGLGLGLGRRLLGLVGRDRRRLPPLDLLGNGFPAQPGDRAAGALDLLAGALREAVRRDGELLL